MISQSLIHLSYLFGTESYSSKERESRVWQIVSNERFVDLCLTNSPSVYSWVAHDVTKNQTKKLSILLSFYFHEVLQYLNTFTETNFWLERVLRFAREDA